LTEDWEVKPEPKVLKCWVNFYRNGKPSTIHHSKEDADRTAGLLRVLDSPIRIHRIGEAVEVTKEVEE